MCMAGGCNMQGPPSTKDTAKHFLSLEPVYECLRASITDNLKHPFFKQERALYLPTRRSLLN
jgi:hypothetical protein